MDRIYIQKEAIELLPEIIKEHSKGNKVRRIYIPQSLRTDTLKWLSFLHKSHGPIFLNRFGSPISPGGIRSQLKTIALSYHMTPEMYRNMENYRDMDRGSGRMYYTEPSMNYDFGSHMESRYDMAKRNYTESKELHRGNTAEDKEHKMKELEKYMREIGSDIAEVISDASSEEKALLKQKLQVIMQKIQ